MRKIRIGEPHIVAQSSNEPIIGGGYQDPLIKCSNGVLYLRFNIRKDTSSTFGSEDGNPLFCSYDEGQTWKEISDKDEWIRASAPLSNGDRLHMLEIPTIYDFPPLPEADEDRKHIATCAGRRTIYTVDELMPYLGSKIEKTFPAKRIPSGSNTPVIESCKVNWKNMDVSFFEDFDPQFIRRYFGMKFYEDKNGVLWMPLSGGFVLDNGKMGSRRACIHLLRSDDNGHTWDYVSTVPYKEEYNIPEAIDVEGFLEAAVLFADNDDIVLIMRSGSLSPFVLGDANHPSPKMYTVRSSDNGKTWEEPEVFYDYGVFPRAVRLNCGTTVMTSGRPGVYIRTCDDKNLRCWSDATHIIRVPDEEIYTGYFNYSCSNNDICVYDDNTAFLAYSDFTMFDKDGKRIKSIIVRKLRIE